MRFAILTVAFAATLFIRVRGITTHFWMLWDQIRDWNIALGPFASLPLVGPPTHFGGYTIGPAFYWILWAVRVTVGPWFENLPHAGGIGQAILQSAADALLLAAVWRRTNSVWIAVGVVVLLATSAYDLCLAPIVWNPVVGSILAKTATALLLLDWHRRSLVRAGVTAAVAWAAVHAYTGAIYVALAVFIALVLEPLVERDRRRAWSVAAVIIVVVALLQLPYVIYRATNRASEPAMSAVSGSVTAILSGRATPRIVKSASAYVSAVEFVQGFPTTLPGIAWILIASGAIVAIRYRRDPLVLCIVLLPQLLAIAGYAFFLGDLDHYYYLALMSAAVMTVVFAIAALTPPGYSGVVGLALVVLVATQVPERLRYSSTLHKMPQYGPLVEGSRKIAHANQPMRAIETEFALPMPSDAMFIYRILGGRSDSTSPWVARISATGAVTYRRIDKRSVVAPEAR